MNTPKHLTTLCAALILLYSAAQGASLDIYVGQNGKKQSFTAEGRRYAHIYDLLRGMEKNGGLKGYDEARVIMSSQISFDQAREIELFWGKFVIRHCKCSCSKS